LPALNAALPAPNSHSTQNQGFEMPNGTDLLSRLQAETAHQKYSKTKSVPPPICSVSASYMSIETFQTLDKTRYFQNIPFSVQSMRPRRSLFEAAAYNCH
jgi:hypothetical protein